MIFRELYLKKFYRMTLGLFLTCTIIGSMGATNAINNDVFAIYYGDVIILQVGYNLGFNFQILTTCF